MTGLFSKISLYNEAHNTFISLIILLLGMLIERKKGQWATDGADPMLNANMVGCDY